MAVKTTIEDYELIKRLGSGAFAQVYLMRDKSDHNLYAIKKVSKSLLKREGKIEQAIRERELLSSLNHKGIVKLHKAFHDPSYLYLVMEYCSKGSLSQLLDRHGRNFPLSIIKCYIAELVEILNVLYKSNIIHRDIKPENILIAQDNHLKLVDFNCAKKLSSRKSMRNTFVGTLNYVAPEIIKNSKEIGHEVDLWSLGCIVFQMVVGRHPFTGLSQEEIFENIIHGRYSLDSDVPVEARSLISSLLVIEPENRLGSNSLADLKAHHFFGGIEFENLWNTQIPDILQEIRKEEESHRRDSDGSNKSMHTASDEESKGVSDEKKIFIEGNVQIKYNIFMHQSRRLVVTIEPKIQLYSLRTKERRGDIDVKTIHCVKTTKSNGFVIETSKKTYEFTVDNPDTWVSAIRKVMYK